MKKLLLTCLVMYSCVAVAESPVGKICKSLKGLEKEQEYCNLAKKLYKEKPEYISDDQFTEDVSTMFIDFIEDDLIELMKEAQQEINKRKIKKELTSKHEYEF